MQVPNNKFKLAVMCTVCHDWMFVTITQRPQRFLKWHYEFLISSIIWAITQIPRKTALTALL